MNDLEYHLYEEAKAGRMTRQQLLVRASVIGASVPALAAILAACGGGGASSSGGGGGSSSAGAVKRGGTGIFGITTPAQDVDPVTQTPVRRHEALPLRHRQVPVHGCGDVHPRVDRVDDVEVLGRAHQVVAEAWGRHDRERMVGSHA